ncbi:MAG: type II and III secretion system protein family protein [Acidobacteriaceae bacterium]
MALAPAARAQRPGYRAATPEDAIQLSQPDRSLEIKVGRSIVIQTLARLHKVYISNPAVLDSLTVNPHQLLLSAKVPGTTTLAIWDEHGHCQLYNVVANMNVAGLQEALDQAFPHERIRAVARQNRVTLSGVVADKDDITRAEQIASGYGKIVTNSLVLAPQHPVEVRLKVRFAEVDRTRARQLGFNFVEGNRTSAAVSTQQFPSFSNYALAGAAGSGLANVTNPLNLLLYNSDLNIAATIQALENDQVLQILAEPTITSLSGVTASFLSGGEFPYPVVQGGTGGLASVSVAFRPYGVRLTFTPYVNSDGTIRLKVAPEVSALDYTNEVQISGYTIPAIDTRSANTEVELRNGQSFAISGLLDHRLTDDFRHMPQVSRIPVLGWLFKSKQVQTATTDLIVIITPEIVNPLEEAKSPPQLPKTVKPYMNDEVFDQRLNPHRKAAPASQHGKGE